MVELRAKKLSSGKFHLFVDVYENGQRRKKYLKIYVSEDYTRPKKDAKGNIIYDKRGRPEQLKILKKDEVNWDIAEKVKTEIEGQLNKKTYGFDTTDYSTINFTKYFEELVEEYNKKDFRKGEACLKLFKSFNEQKDVLCRDIDEDYVIEFRDHLVRNTTGDTPSSYFRFFKTAVKKAHKKGFLKTNYGDDVTAKKGNSDISKDVISIEELRKLNKFQIKQAEVKEAFIFSYFTGLDCATLRTMTGKNIIEVDGKPHIRGQRTKNGVKFQNPLNKTCLKILEGRIKDDTPLFKLKSHTTITKGLKNWLKAADVKRHITFHCARHSFGTNLIAAGTDLKSASVLMAHKGLREIEKYVKVVGKLKLRAIKKLPELEV